MSLRKLGMALMAVMALGAVSANSSFAADEVQTDPASWTTAAGTLAQNTPVPIECEKTAASANFVLTSSVGEGSPLKLTATGVKCPEATIENSTAETIHHATANGFVEFTGVTVDEPLGCSTPATNKTVKLHAEVLMGKGTTPTKKGFVKFTPASGTTFTNITLSGCAAEGKYPVKGFTYGEATHETETGHFEVQEAAGNATTCAMSGLTVGASNSACLEGEIAARIAGPTPATGTAFGVEPF